MVYKMGLTINYVCIIKHGLLCPVLCYKKYSLSLFLM